MQSFQTFDDLVGRRVFVVIPSQCPRDHGKGVLVLQGKTPGNRGELEAAFVAFYRRHGHHGGHLFEWGAEFDNAPLVARADLRVRGAAVQAPAVEVGGNRVRNVTGLDLGWKIHIFTDANPVFIRFPSRYVWLNRSVVRYGPNKEVDS